MKSKTLKRIPVINIVLYILLAFILIGLLITTVNFFIYAIGNPPEYEPLCMGSMNVPVMRPFEDVFFYIEPVLLQDDPLLDQKLQYNEFIFESIHGFLVLFVFLLLLLQLKNFIGSIRNRSFFSLESVNNVKKISFIVLSWVLIDFLAYQLLPLAIPLDCVVERINYVTLGESFFSNILFSVDITKLLFAFTFYSISVVLKEGLVLKQQSELTI